MIGGEMHFSLLVLADGTKTLEEMMEPFYETYDEEAESFTDNSKWDWYSVGGRWRGLIEAKVGGHGRRSCYDFESWFLPEGKKEPYPDDDTHFDIARVCDITSLDTNLIYAVLTPDGVWHDSEIYYPDGDEQGRHFVQKEGWHDSLWERYVEPNMDCVAIIVDYHD